MNRKFEDQVFYVTSRKDETVLVAVGLTVKKGLIEGDKVYLLRWFDTVYWREMAASELHEQDGYISFKRIEAEGGGVYYLIPMSLEIYNNLVKNELFNSREFRDEAEFRRAFLAMVKSEV